MIPLVWDFEWCPRYCSYVFYNAFYTSLKDNKFIECEFNIVDEKGKELVKSKKYVLQNNRGSICFDGIGSEIMELINEKKAFLNPVACYLMHGCRKEDWGEGAFYNDMDSLQEMPLFMEKSVFICGKNKEDKIGKNVFSTMDFGCEKTELENSLNYFLEMYCWYSDSENEIQFYPEFHKPFTKNHIIVEKTVSKTSAYKTKNERTVVVSYEKYEYDNSIYVSREIKKDFYSTIYVVKHIGNVITIPVVIVSCVAGTLVNKAFIK